MFIGVSAVAATLPDFKHDIDVKTAKPQKYATDKTRFSGVKKAGNVSRSDAPTTDPSGEEKVYVTNWMQLFGSAIVDNTGLAHRVRFASDGKVYFHDFFAIGNDGWIEGSIDGNGLITIPTHQIIPQSGPYGDDMTLELSTFVIEEESMHSVVDMEAESFTLQLKEDGSIVSSDIDLPWEERHYPVAIFGDKVFALCGAINMVPLSDKPVAPPSGIDPVEYSYSFRQQDFYAKATVVNGIFDGDDVYFSGLCPSIPETWIKGTFNDDHTKLVFQSGQYMGFGQYHHYFTAAHKNPDASDSDPSVPGWLKDEELVLDVAPDGVSFSFDSGNYFAVTIDGDVSYVLRSSKLTPYPPAEYAAPIKPLITIGSELLWLEADFLPFVQPNVDVNGNYLDVANLSWRMYYDDELFSFQPSEYWYLENETQEIPYCYSDDWDFIVYTDVMEECVAIYRTDYKTIGIESVYRTGDQCLVSDRAYFYSQSSSVKDIETESELLESGYFDLSGRKVSKPAPGLYIRIDRFADGTVKTGKERIM